MTVTHVLGCGMQRAVGILPRCPRGNNTLPKVKIEIVICKVPLDLLLETVKKALYTGKIGDGKIFITM